MSDGPGSASRLELDLAKALGARYERDVGRNGRQVDFASKDGATIIEVKAFLHGARDLYAAVTQLALIASEWPRCERAILVAWFPKLGAGRVQGEWERIVALMRPQVAKLLGLVAITSEGGLALPAGDAELIAVLGAARRARPRDPVPSDSIGTAPRWTPKAYEVWKVLLAAWLRGETSVAIGELGTRSGASYETVAGVVAHGERRGEIARGKNRSVTMKLLPRTSLAEVIALGDGLRPTMRYVDESGGAPHTQDLLRRVIAKAPLSVALGGVEAARHYMPELDLNGLPRIDVTCELDATLDWVAKVDPALRPMEPSPRGPLPLLVVHRLRRPLSLFDEPASSRLPIADPAEVLLDLLELRLVDQAEELATALRKEHA